MIEAQVHYDTVNQFDSVAGGHLVLDAPYLDVQLSELKMIRPQVFDAASSRANTTVVFDDIREKRDPSVSGVALCIQIIIFRTGGRTLHGLLLEPCSDQSFPCETDGNNSSNVKRYKRIGMFKRSIRNEPSLPPLYDELLKLIRDPGPDLDATFELEKVSKLRRFYVV